jgi:hypothetical protein
MFPEPFRRSYVHFLLVNRVVFRDWYASGVGIEGIFDCAVCGCLYDATLPVGVHLHAAHEHAVLSVVVGKASGLFSDAVLGYMKK